MIQRFGAVLMGAGIAVRDVLLGRTPNQCSQSGPCEDRGAENAHSGCRRGRGVAIDDVMLDFTNAVGLFGCASATGSLTSRASGRSWTRMQNAGRRLFQPQASRSAFNLYMLHRDYLTQLAPYGFWGN